jgi:hypothetical protein
MSGKLSPAAQARYSAIQPVADKVHRVHGLVEQYAAARGSSTEHLGLAASRAFSQLKLHFMGIGLDSLSQLCGSMEIAARRGMAQHSKARILRDGVASLRFQLELELRSIVSEDQAAQRRQQQEEEEGRSKAGA